MPEENLSQYSHNPKEFQHQLVDAFHCAVDFTNVLNTIVSALTDMTAKTEPGEEKILLSNNVATIKSVLTAFHTQHSAVLRKGDGMTESDLFDLINAHLPELLESFDNIFAALNPSLIAQNPPEKKLLIEKSCYKKAEAKRLFDIINGEWRLAKSTKQVLFREVLSKNRRKVH